MKQSRRKRCLGLLLVVAMLTSLLGTGALAAPTGSLTMPPAGQNGYTSMHTYVSNTDIPGVYRVTQQVSGLVEKIIPTADVVVVVDYSGSMGNLIVNSSYAIDKARQGLLRMVNIFWDTSKPIEEQEMFRIGVLGFDNSVPLARETAGASTTPSNIGGMLYASNRGELLNFINTTFAHTPGGGTNMPAGFNRAYDSNVYFNAKNNPAAPASYKTADYRFMILIGDGATSNTVNLVQEAVRAGDLDEVFVLGVSGSGFGHDLSVPNLPSSHVPPPIVPSSSQANEQALINISTVFTDAIYASAPPNGLNSSSTTGNFAASWPTRTMATDVSHYNYYYADQDSIAAAAFQDMADKIVAQVGVPATGIYAETKIGSGFELYNYPGAPMFEQKGQMKTDGSGDIWNAAGTVSNTGQNIRWDIDEIPDDGSQIELVYYIKANDSNSPDLSYPVFDDSFIFYHTVQSINGVDTPGTIVNHFPIPYIKGGAVDSTSPGGPGGSSGLPSDPNGIPADGSGNPIQTGTGGASSKPSTGAEGHQQNRDLAAATASWGGGADITPNVPGVTAGTDSSGRSKVQVELTNGSTMRYQWQFKNAAGEWEDIFGANSSHYTLGRQFSDGQTLELRAKITNAAGKVSFSDSVEVTVEGKVSTGLQTKEEGPSIDGENLMDAGEEITVANTATNGQILAVIAALALVAVIAMAAISYRRRRG